MKDEMGAWYDSYDDNMPLFNLQISKRNKQYISKRLIVFIVFSTTFSFYSATGSRACLTRSCLTSNRRSTAPSIALSSHSSLGW